jgi:transcriptional regulator with XRE-family HTH domain
LSIGKNKTCLSYDNKLDYSNSMTKEASEEFISWLKAEMGKREWGIRETARKSGLSPSPISYILSNREQPTFDTCIALAQAFDIPGEDVLRLAGLLPKPPGFNPRTSEMIGMFAELPEDDQEEMLQMVRLRRQQREKRSKHKV